MAASTSLSGLPPLGLMISQNIVWLACPPRLLRTPVRMASGTALRLPSTSTMGFSAICGVSLAKLFRLVT